jgi:hypothetical protein
MILYQKINDISNVCCCCEKHYEKSMPLVDNCLAEGLAYIHLKQALRNIFNVLMIKQ